MGSESSSGSASPKKAIRGLLVAVLALFAITLIAGCGSSGSTNGGGGGSSEEAAGKPQEGGTLEISQGEEILGMNPLTQYVPEDVNVMEQQFETLWKPDKEGKIVPWLAENAKSADNDTVWTLQLKKGIKFSDGQPMTSADVKWTLERDFESEVYLSIMEAFEKVEAPSPYSIVIKMKEPRPELPEIMTQWTFAVLPKNFGGVSEKEFAANPVGTGPFKFVSWKKGEAVTLEKNPYYWRKGLPYLQKVVFHTVQNPNSRVAQLRGGQLQAINVPPFQELESLEQSGYEVAEYGEGFAWIIILNNKKPMFQNQKVREAINIGVDRNAMLETAQFGRGQLAASYLTPNSAAWDSALKVPELNVEKAKQLVAEAVKEGVNPTFSLLVPAEVPFWITSAQIAQANLEEIGFKVSIKKADNSTVISLADEANFDAFAVFNALQVATPVELFSWYIGSHGNWTFTNTSQIEKLMNEGQAEANATKRQAIWNQIQQIIYEEESVIPLTYSHFMWALNKNVSGFTVSPYGVLYLGEASLNE